MNDQESGDMLVPSCPNLVSHCIDGDLTLNQLFLENRSGQAKTGLSILFREDAWQKR